MAANNTRGSERDKVSRMLRDPKGYYADSRRWAKEAARADVAREMERRRKAR